MTSYTRLPLMARMAYIVMCVETYLVHVHPDRDWRPLARAFWHFPLWSICDWLFFYAELTPDVALHHPNYDDLHEGIQCDISRQDYECLIRQYHGITEGNADDPHDELCAVLNIPFDLMNEYDAYLSDGNVVHNTRWPLESSLGYLKAIEKILSRHSIEMPDMHALDFLAITDEKMLAEIEKIESDAMDIDYGAIPARALWGPHYEGEPLSIILNAV